jgi:hypothetical protein
VAESPTRRRRITAIGVLALAAGALIATSPPPPPRSTLDATFHASPRLTAAAPRVTGVVTLELSAAALPAPASGQLRVSGTVEIAAANVHSIGIRVRPLGVVAARGEGQVPGTWSIEQLCRVAEPCRRDFEVTLELIAPPASESVPAPFEATVQIVYAEIDQVPLGATVSWSATPELSPAPAGT